MLTARGWVRDLVPLGILIPGKVIGNTPTRQREVMTLE
jgi:hypothetical protein